MLVFVFGSDFYIIIKFGLSLGGSRCLTNANDRLFRRMASAASEVESRLLALLDKHISSWSLFRVSSHVTGW